MECPKFTDEKLLEAHGELEAAPAFRTHLADCAGCRVDVEEMREIAAEYRAASADRLPERIRRRVIVPRWARSRVFDWAIPALAAAVLIALMLIPVLSPKTPGVVPPPVTKKTPEVEVSGVRGLLSLDDKIDLVRQRSIAWDAPESRVDYDLRTLRRDVELLQLTTDDM